MAFTIEVAVTYSHPEVFPQRCPNAATCDSSEDAYSGVVYLRMEDSTGDVHVALVASKTQVAPIKCLSIPRLELCGAFLLTKLLRDTLQIPIEDVTAWTDSTIVINWLDDSPCRFKTYVGNGISFIIPAKS